VPHEFESGVFTSNTPAWHGLGVVLPQERLFGDEVLHHAGLDWTVEKTPLHLPGSDTPIPDFFGVKRSSDNRVLGIVGNQYEPFQNAEGIATMDELVSSDEAIYETAGSLRKGAVVWLLARPPKDRFIAGEAHIERLLMTWGHDGKTGLRARPIMTRVVCQNTLTAALAERRPEISVRHTADIRNRLVEARRVFGLAEVSWQQMADRAERLAMRKMSDAAFAGFLGKLFKPGVPDSKLSQTIAANRRAAVTDIYTKAPNLDGIRGTEWGAYNAVVEWNDHSVTRRATGQSSREDNRFEAIMMKTNVSQRALALLTK
jgi:phage/plasmid-like protein (TIGR03299 family)